MSENSKLNPFYKVDQILSTEERHELLDTYNNLEGKYAHQDYNLFDVTKKHFEPETLQHHAGIKALEKYALSHDGVGGTYAHYFLHYGRDAFTKNHSDDDAAIGLTIVTLLETTDNLVGGDTLITLPYTKEEHGLTRDSEPYVKRQLKGELGKAPIGQRVIPRIVPMVEGDSVIYDRSLMHAVTQVESGHRVVLVSWFKTDNDV